MIRFCLSLLVCLSLIFGVPMTAPAQESKDSAPATAAPRAEKRLQDLLQPSARMAGAGLRTQPIRWPGRRNVEQPSFASPPYRGAPPHLVLAGKEVLPHALSEGMPLAGNRETPEFPTSGLPVEPLVRLYSVDPRLPIPLPILAQPQKDRVSLADPTFDVSVAAALKALTPERTEPIPFAPVNLPDPFEFVQPGRFGPSIPENPMPALRR